MRRPNRQLDDYTDPDVPYRSLRIASSRQRCSAPKGIDELVLTLSAPPRALGPGLRPLRKVGAAETTIYLGVQLLKLGGAFVQRGGATVELPLLKPNPLR